MSLSTKTLSLWGLLLFIVLVGLLFFVRVPLETYKQTKHTTNAGELVGGSLVGQTFKSAQDNLSAVSIMFATYSGRNNTAPVRFHLKESFDAKETLREAVVNPNKLGDNQFYNFTFSPIAGSKNKTYFFYVTSPAGVAGDAVTIDLNTQDPYHLGSAYLVASAGGNADNPAAIARSGKQTVDVVFGTSHTVPLRVGLISAVTDVGRNFVATWADQRGNYLLWLELMAGVGLFVGLVVWLGRKSEDISKSMSWYLLGGLILAGFLLRILYGTSMPLTNDEGNYLYDAASLLSGTLAGGDGYVKAPLVVFWLAIWQVIAGPTLFAGRLASIVIGLLTAMPLFSIGQSLINRRAGILVAAAWLLLGAPVVFTVYAHTQPVAVFFGTAAIAVLFLALKSTERRRLFIATGALLGLGVASRKSVMALGLLPLVFILFQTWPWRDKVKKLFQIGLGFAAIMLVFFFWAWFLYGSVGVQEAIGVNSAEDGIFGVDPAEKQQALEYSIRGLTPFFRESLPLILLSLLGWGLTLEQAVRQRVKHIISKAIWLLPFVLGYWGWSFFLEYEGSRYHEFFGMSYMWYAIALTMIISAFWFKRSEVKKAKSDTTGAVVTSSQPDVVKDKILQGQWFLAALLPALWVGGLYIFYSNWIKFHANYLVEFLVPLAIMSGLGAYLFLQKVNNKIIVTLFIALLIWTGYTSQYITYYFEHTGTFDLRSVEEAAAWAKQNIPANQTIFTGAAAIPYRSGHRTALDIAHPRWYAYEFTRKNPSRLNTFLPSAEEMVQAFREADWVLLERQTGFSFLMEYTEIEKALLEGEFEKVHEVENLSNPLQFYKRKR